MLMVQLALVVRPADLPAVPLAVAVLVALEHWFAERRLELVPELVAGQECLLELKQTLQWTLHQLFLLEQLLL
ncbi:hypothetical protein ODU07_03410 [Streptococcus suis]|nr:hypothetical protein [Streptococcus suis]